VLSWYEWLLSLSLKAGFSRVGLGVVLIHRPTFHFYATEYLSSTPRTRIRRVGQEANRLQTVACACKILEQTDRVLKRMACCCCRATAAGKNSVALQTCPDAERTKIFGRGSARLIFSPSHVNQVLTVRRRAMVPVQTAAPNQYGPLRLCGGSYGC